MVSYEAESVAYHAVGGATDAATPVMTLLAATPISTQSPSPVPVGLPVSPSPSSTHVSHPSASSSSSSSLCLLPSPSPTQVPTPSPRPSSACAVPPPGHTLTPADSPPCPFPITRPTKKRKQSESADDILKIALQKLCSLPSSYESDPYLDYGRVVGNELKSMNERQMFLAKKLINDVIHLGNMEMLTKDHQVLQVTGSYSF